MSWNQNQFPRQSNAIGQQLQNPSSNGQFQGPNNFALNTHLPGHGGFNPQQSQLQQSQQSRSSNFPDSRPNINQQFLAQPSQYSQYASQTTQVVPNTGSSLLQNSLTPQQAQQLQQLLAMQLIQQNTQQSQPQQGGQSQSFMQSQYGTKQPTSSSNFQHLQLVQQQQQLQQQQLQQQQLQQLQQQQLQQRMLQQPQQQKSQNIGSQVPLSVTPEQWMLMQQQQLLLQQQQQIQQNAGAQSKRPTAASAGPMARNDRSREPLRPKDRENFAPFRGGRRRSPPPGSNVGPVARQRRSPPRRSPPRERDRSPRRGRDSQRDKIHRSKSVSRSPSRTPSRSRSPPRYREKEFLHRKDREPSEERDRDRKYAINMSTYSVVEQDRDYENVKRRYPRLHIQDDFSKAVACWSQTLPFDKQRNILQYLPIYCQFSPTKADDKHSTPTTEDDAKHSGVKYTAAVALTSGIQTKPGTHLSSQIKFLVAKQDRSDLMLIGGPWSKSADGGDPADSDGALIKTATRWAQHYANLNLSGCTKWYRFMEIQYKKPLDAANSFVGFETEVVVVFLVDISEIAPSLDQFLEDWAKHKQKRNEKVNTIQNTTEQEVVNNVSKPELDLTTAPEETAGPQSTEQPATTPNTEVNLQVDSNEINLNEQPQPESETLKERTDKEDKEAPKVPGLIVTSWKPECVLISLAGLLDYNLSDKNEKTFEVSLFAELYHEMLQRDFGNSILQAVLEYRDVSVKKRKRESDLLASPSPTFSSPSETQLDSENTNETKKMKIEPNPQETAIIKEEPINQEEIKLNDPSQQPEDLAPNNPQEHPSPVIQPKKEKKIEIVVDEALTQAFQYFDRNLTGYMSTDDLEVLLHSLGYYFSKRYAHQLALKVVDPQIFKRVYYKKLTEKEVEPPDQTFS